MHLFTEPARGLPGELFLMQAQKKKKKQPFQSDTGCTVNPATVSIIIKVYFSELKNYQVVG